MPRRQLMKCIVSFLLAVISPVTLEARVVSDESRAEAKWLLERLTGVKWAAEDPVVQQMGDLVAQGKRDQAAQLATSQAPFYNVTVKQLAAQMSTREESIRTPLNDFSAAFIGVTRDQRDARELLTGDFFYMGDAGKLNGTQVPMRLAQDVLESNSHYQGLQDAGLNLADVLVRVEGQKLEIDGAKNTVPNPDPAGVLTSRSFLQAHATAGTNRRLVEFTFREFMCVKLPEWADPTSSDLRIGRDIDRFPGGDHNTFQTTCKACHSVMDGFRGAFARWDFQNNIAVNADSGGRDGATPDADKNKVMRKMNKNATVYPGGYVMIDDSWVNNAIQANNATLFGWRQPASLKMNGVQGLGALVANSARFSQCLAQRVFQTVCHRDLKADQLSLVSYRLGLEFEKNNYNLKKQFELTALDPQCRD